VPKWVYAVTNPLTRYRRNRKGAAWIGRNGTQRPAATRRGQRRVAPNLVFWMTPPFNRQAPTERST
jgi:hypothetical protein